MRFFPPVPLRRLCSVCTHTHRRVADAYACLLSHHPVLTVFFCSVCVRARCVCVSLSLDARTYAAVAAAADTRPSRTIRRLSDCTAHAPNGAVCINLRCDLMCNDHLKGFVCVSRHRSPSMYGVRCRIHTHTHTQNYDASDLHAISMLS